MVLSGVNSVTLYDPNAAQVEDMGANFFLRENDVGKTSRAAAAVPHLKELNPFVTVNFVEKLEAKMMANYSVIVVTELLFPLDVIHEFNKEARRNNRGFVFTLCLGVHGIVFVDFGNNHTIRDANGINTTMSYISRVESGERTTIFLCDDVEISLISRTTGSPTANTSRSPKSKAWSS